MRLEHGIGLSGSRTRIAFDRFRPYERGVADMETEAEKRLQLPLRFLNPTR